MELRRYLLVINFVLTALIGWTAYGGYMEWSASRQKGPMSSRTADTKIPNDAQARRSTGLSQYQSIISRDIFGTTVQVPQVKVESPKIEQPKMEEIPISRRSLHLKGTVVGRDNRSYAVIVDGGNPEGEVFRVNDSLHNARILEILPDRVILEAEGKQEALIITYELEPDGRSIPPVGRPEAPSIRNRLPALRGNSSALNWQPTRTGERNPNQ